MHVGRRRVGAWLLAVVVGVGAPAAAYAQATPILIEPLPTPDYDRDRNVSVSQRPKPEYDALGIRLGSFVASPSTAVSMAFSDNVYTNNDNKHSDIYLIFQPYLNVSSDWNVHRMSLTAAGDIRRYASQTLKDQNTWYVYTDGRLDIGRDIRVELDAQIDRAVESPYSEDIAANLTVPSSYLRTLAAVKGVHTGGQSRITGTLDRSTYTFSDIRFADGVRRTQDYRDRTINRGSLAFEKAASPSASFYVQATYDITDYSSPTFFGQPNRDSKGYVLALGSSFDLAGLARGTVAVGYTYRDYDANLYADPEGLSVQARAEWFATELTTVNLAAQRRLLDVSLGNSGAYWDTRIRAGADHELLYNLVVSGGIEAIDRNYTEYNARTRVYQADLGARYQANRWLGLEAQIGFGSSRSTGDRLTNPFDELRSFIRVQVRR